MDSTIDHSPQHKRKQASSPTADTSVKKKTPNTATSTTTKTPTTSASGSALITATRATEYACELVQSLADEYYTEELIGPCLSKVAKALEQVCNALKLLDKDQRPPPGKKDASTATEPNTGTPAANEPKTSSKPAEKTGQTANGNGRRRKTKKSKLDQRTPAGNTPAQAKTAPPSEATSQPGKTQPEEPEEPFTLVANTRSKPNANRPQTTRKTAVRPAAVLIKVGEGRTYADTLRQVRGTQIDFEGLGTHVTSMRKTLKGDLLVELTKGAKATAATAAIRDKLAESIEGSTVTRLRHTAEIEITDLDEVTTKEEVLAAIIKSAPDDQPLSADDVKITGLWATRDSRQMATATVPISVSQRLTSVRVGWTQSRVRPRRPEPAKCYRCHGFGHGTRQCTGPDLSHACRRCGLTGHTQATCGEADHCVACDRMKAPRVPHKPGSGACAARRKAISELNAPINRK
jgi:hypothetical protein